jgi:hypothetical protein
MRKRPCDSVCTGTYRQAEFTGTGGYVWGKSFGTPGQSNGPNAVLADPSGDVVVGGMAYADLNLGGGPITGYYIAKFGPSGAYSWSNGFDITCDEAIPTIAADSDGNVLLVGCFVGSADFGGGTMSTDHYSAFVAKFDSSGEYEWAKQYGNGATVSGVAVDACDDILVTGNFGGLAMDQTTIDFGTGTLTASNPNDVYSFLAKLGASGASLWAQEFSASGTNVALMAGGIVVDGAGQPATTYGLTGRADFGGDVLTSMSSTTPTMAVASFGSTGSYRWDYSETASSTSVATTAAVAAHGASLVIVGAFGTCTSNCTDGTSEAGATLVLPGQTLTAASARDLFVATFAQ